MDRFSQMGLAAALMAWDDAKLKAEDVDSQRTGVIMGTGIGGVSTWEDAFRSSEMAENASTINAFTIPRIMNNAASAYITMRLWLKGINHTINTACSASNSFGFGGSNAVLVVKKWRQIPWMQST